MASEIRGTSAGSEHESKLIQHLGIISGICNESRLAELIDGHIEQKRRKVSVGQAVQAMILNALGFPGRALYLTARFYTNRPVDLLVGEGIQQEIYTIHPWERRWMRSMRTELPNSSTR